MLTVGYIGLGRMGKAIARNILKAGFPLVVHNRSRLAVDELSAEGARPAFSPAEVATQVDVVFANLPDTPDVEQVVLDEKGILEGAHPGLVWVDNSTIRPAAARDMAVRLAGEGILSLDAPVSGGDSGAREATLAIMVGGPTEAFSSQDHENLAPMMTGAKKNMQAIGKGENYFEGRQLSADSNYHNYANLALCKAEGLDAYIPDLQFRKRDERFARQERFKDGIHPRKRTMKPQARKEDTFTTADFLFDESKQAYLCPQGKVLKCGARGQRNRYRVYDIYRARQEDCASCRLRPRCLSGPRTPRRYLSVRVDDQKPNLIDEMKAKIDTPQGKQIYARRLAIVEPVFANICVQKQLDRFTLRTKVKVDVQWRLFALMHNIGKIHNYGLVN